MVRLAGEIVKTERDSEEIGVSVGDFILVCTGTLECRVEWRTEWTGGING